MFSPVNIPITVAKLIKWKTLHWLPAYLKHHHYCCSKKVIEKVTDIIILVVDHFEPSKKDGQKGEYKVAEWCSKYKKAVANYFDSNGRPLQHTWFYRYDYPNSNCLKTLSKCVFEGYGEVEFHLHHKNDNSDNFMKSLKEGVDWFNTYGAMIDFFDNRNKKFAYIAGNWALDNGRKNSIYSGVNNELEILSENGCYADFTFPALGVSSQPNMVNSIYYAYEDQKPKSYNKGKICKVGIKPNGGFLMFQGPLQIDWDNRYIEDSAIEQQSPYNIQRLGNWINAGVHVYDRPEWLFIKLHTHGMQSEKTFLGDGLQAMCKDFEKLSHNKKRIHFVTAREAFNVVQAAIDGKAGSPFEFIDYCIKSPVNKFVCSSRQMRSIITNKCEIKIFFDTNGPTEVSFKIGGVEQIVADNLGLIHIQYFKGKNFLINLNGGGRGKIYLRDCTTPQEIELPFSGSEKDFTIS